MLARHLHHLPSAPAQQDTHDAKIETDLTESYKLHLQAVALFELGRLPRHRTARRRKLMATFDEAERAANRNEHGDTAHVVMVKADDRTSRVSTHRSPRR